MNVTVKEQWIHEAKVAQSKAYVPYSKFPVGAALIAKDGQIYQGCNIENASFGLTNCAERTAFFKAVSAGNLAFEHLVIVGNTDEPISPCGACRQVMVEFCQPEMSVTLVSGSGSTKETTVAELLPYSFTDKQL